MRNNVLACIYPFVQEYSDSPFSPQIIAQATKCDDVKEVEKIFKELRSDGLISRKHMFTSVFRVTEEGLNAAQQAFEEQQKTLESNK